MTTSSHNSTTPSVSVAAASGNNQSQLVATPVPDEQRISFWPQHFRPHSTVGHPGAPVSLDGLSVRKLLRGIPYPYTLRLVAHL